ncbi:MAG: hypothetical protein HY098_06780 [Nitrospinae bacterium]|nr:hypothetical protein [Nitrospinota bacterium]
MKTRAFLLATALVGIVTLTGCTKGKAPTFPEKSPAEVATTFFKLLQDQGRLSNQEALKMVSTKYIELNPDSFRKWTENFGTSASKIKVVGTTLPMARTKSGDWVATVNLEIKTPSLFGDFFTSTSKLNLILDEKEKEWKVDFVADTVDETQYMTASQGHEHQAHQEHQEPESGK